MFCFIIIINTLDKKNITSNHLKMTIGLIEQGTKPGKFFGFHLLGSILRSVP